MDIVIPLVCRCDPYFPVFQSVGENAGGLLVMESFHFVTYIGTQITVVLSGGEIKRQLYSDIGF